MKRFLFLILGIFSFLALMAFSMLEDKTAKMFSQIGITQAEANDYLWNNVTNVSFSFPRTQELIALAKGSRPALVQQCFAYAKQYVTSTDFQQRYADYRTGMKPQPPETLKTMDQQRDEQRKQMLEAKKNFQETMKSMTPEQQEQMKPAVETFDKQLKALDDPDNPMFSKDMDTYRHQAYQQSVEEFNKKVQAWSAQYPENPSTMIRHALEGFLETSASIDYNAEVFKDANGTMLFAKTIYEQKPREWKLCYRAGKETVEAARSASKQWLAELP